MPRINKKKLIFGVDSKIFFLGIVSFLTDVSSEMIFSVFSIFVTVILGISAFILGLIEGLADFASSSLDYVSGFFSDKLGKRKGFATLGYTFSTASKSILLFTSSTVGVLLFRVVERLGKSFRGPPRDSWISSISSAEKRGYSFGVHKALDKAGAIIGPLVAYFIISSMGQNLHTFKVLFIIAIIPAALAVFLILLIKEKKSKSTPKENIFKAWRKMGRGFNRYLIASGIFSIAYFSFAFLLLKAYIVGFIIADVILLYALFNLSFVFISVPIGKLGDKIGRKKIILLEYILYILMAIGFVFATTKIEVIILFIVFGMFYAIDEGQSKAFISDLEPSKKATAIGLYNFVTGLIYLPASLIAGYLWKINPNYSFIFAAIITIIALVYFAISKDLNLRKKLS